ncbi:hypothetical protein [Methylibium sp.]|uniref:hypothetical protein n=1 Tax=Methylibium sp. TaxID=2067992 RepID=UPI003D150FF4
MPTIEALLDNIKVNQGWNEEDVRLVATATEGQVEALLQNADRSQFKRRVRVLLNLGELAQGAADAKAVARVTLELLHRWSAADPVMAVRLRHYLPEVARHDAS